MFRRKKRAFYLLGSVLNVYISKSTFSPTWFTTPTRIHAPARLFAAAFCRRIISFISQKPVPTHTYNVSTTSYRCHFHAVGMFRGNLFDIFSLAIDNLCHFHMCAFLHSHFLSLPSHKFSYVQTNLHDIFNKFHYYLCLIYSEQISNFNEYYIF